MDEITIALRDWFEEEKRFLPWREKLSPYRVWVSEVMLQQTQVSVVIPYFEKWMQQFPTIEKLASSDLDDVIKCWEGLGYYSRARNMHAAARQIMSEFDGEIPSDFETLLKIKGFGPYTAGAVLSFAYGKRAAGIDELSCSKSAKDKVGSVVDAILPNQDSRDIMESIIELGALVCKKKPDCMNCPIQKHCKAMQRGMQDLLPRKKPRVKTEHLHRQVVLITDGKSIIIQKNTQPGLMEGLSEFPYFEQKESITKEAIDQRFEINASFYVKLKAHAHSFTRYKAHLYPTLWIVDDLKSTMSVKLKNLNNLAFSSGHKRVAIEVMDLIQNSLCVRR